MPKIYPTITTIGNDFIKKIKEAEDLGLVELCVFFTGLNKEERKPLYNELEKSKIEKIPFAHIRGDFDKDELNYLKENFGTMIFNIHSRNEYPIYHNYEELKKEIFMENTLTKFAPDELDDYAGLCIDVSHLENDRRVNMRNFKYFWSLVKKVSCGCGHISAIKKRKAHCLVAESERYDNHYFEKLEEFDYVKKYKRILPPILALEVQNSLTSQLKAINYINSILKI